MSAEAGLELGISIGTRCTFKCRHCIVGHNKKARKVTGREISLLAATINKYRPRSVVFTGGEPTLYLKEINRIISHVKQADQIEFRLVTNGYFAKTTAASVQKLKTLVSINAVQLSYDEFHAEFLQLDRLHNLRAACKKLNISFSLVVSIRSPLDMLIVNGLGPLPGVNIAFQKVLAMGEAANNDLGYRYDAFDPSVLEKRCPNLGKLVYNCGSGFTVCCAQLAELPDRRDFVHPSVGEHTESRFYRLISKFTFGELLNISKLKTKDLGPADSAPCMLCAKIVPAILTGTTREGL